MSETNLLWLMIVLAGVLTYIIRLPFIQLIGNKPIPQPVKNAMRFIPPAVLSAIIFPELLQYSGALDLSFTNDRLVAGLAAFIIAWKTKNVIITIVSGMVILWLLQLI